MHFLHLKELNGEHDNDMNAHIKKQICLLTMCVCVGVAVYLLFPYGNSLLLVVRAQNSAQHQIQHGKEVVYLFIDRGNIEVADEILQDEYELSRFKSVHIDSITWNEDPYKDIYWRFNFYNLEPVRHLLYAWGVTDNPVYKDKLVDIVTSFIDNGMDNQYSWDLHGAAFRTMTLVDVWQKLQNKGEFEGNGSPRELSAKILAALEVHGNFLADPNNYQEAYNHGLDQSAALYLLAVNFPNMPSADSWREISEQRIDTLLDQLVDSDGVLVENSPFYHLYVLQKFWEINQYLNTNNLSISPDLNERLDQMVSYATYILQPDLHSPTVGASLREEAKLAGIYEEMAKQHPEFLYVLTKGAEGKEPAKLNVQYLDSGQTIMRSGWGKGEDFTNQTQLIFDVGGYRTNHSDLDALSLNLYSKGLALMPDAGLYTYDPGPYRSYFHGTRAHNTVVVDGQDQPQGKENAGSESKVYAGRFEEGDGYVYQSGEHELYKDVSHERAITMIEDSTVLIFDNLKSDKEHTYEQMFHLFPGAEVNINSDGSIVVARGENEDQTVTIRQFITDGVELTPVIDQQEPLDGICSFEYKVAVPCYSLSYLQKGKSISYVTAISIGSDLASIDFSQEEKSLQVTTKDKIYNITISETEGTERNINVEKNFNISTIYNPTYPVSALNAYDSWVDDKESNSQSAIVKTGNALKVITPIDGSDIQVQHKVDLDLSQSNLYFKIKVENSLNLDSFDVHLSNNNWEKDAVYYAQGNTYDVNRDGEWLQFGVGKGEFRKVSLGNWLMEDPTFDWTKIDGVRLTLSSRYGRNVVELKDFTLSPDQKEARAVIIFDDGEASIADAVPIMHKHGFRGVVGVITGSIGSKRYLTLDYLKMLQNEYGWDIANHSSLHKEAVKEYVDKNNMEGYETDITDALQYLIKNGINTSPNWYIYPHGSLDGRIKEIIGKYYKFARGVNTAPESFPFSKPLEVAIFPVYSDRANNRDVHDAIRDAIKYKQTIMLVFHQFSTGTPQQYTEWQLSQFDSLLQDIEDQGIKVVTFSEFDEENGISPTEFTVKEFIPQQFDLDISVAHNPGSSMFTEIFGTLKDLVN